MPLCKEKMHSSRLLKAECRSAVCRMCPFSGGLHKMLVLSCRESFSWWRRWAPRLCHLTKLLLEGEGSVYRQGWGTFLNLQKYSLILKGRGDLKFILTPLGNLWLSGKLRNYELWALFQTCVPHVRQKLLSFCKLLIWIF